MTDTPAQTLLIENQIIRIKQASTYPADALILLHGYTGNENSMDIFHNKIPSSFACLSPRAFFQIGSGQYSWIDPNFPGADHSSVGSYVEAAKQVNQHLKGWTTHLNGKAQKLHLAGFSQGAALAYVLLALYPQNFERIIGLSGFLPEGYTDLLSSIKLSSNKIFISHGNKDKIIPIEMGQEAAAVLKKAGADVVYCEDQVQHKLSLDCIKSLGNFLS